MKIQLTQETIASQRLYSFFYNSKNAKVHSWHPPDSKAYFTRLLQIPYNGRRSHVDLIVQIGTILYLIEVKNCTTNSQDDLVKLSKIKNNFSIQQLIKLFSSQGTNFEIHPTEVQIVIASYIPYDDFSNENHHTAIITANENIIKGENYLGQQIIDSVLI